MDREKRLFRKGGNTAFWAAAHLCRISVFTSGENLGSGSAEPPPSIEIPRVKPLSGRRNPKQKDIRKDVLSFWKGRLKSIFLNGEKCRPQGGPPTASPAQRVAVGSEEQQNERAMSFVIK